jgi:hypothetical protein
MNLFQSQVLGSLILAWVVSANFAENGPTTRQSPDSSEKAAEKTNPSHDEKSITFKIMMAGETHECRVHFAITNYLSSDGVGLTVIHNEFASDASAQECFKKILAKAVRITERGKKKEEEGKRRTKQEKPSERRRQRFFPRAHPTDQCQQSYSRLVRISIKSNLSPLALAAPSK